MAPDDQVTRLPVWINYFMKSPPPFRLSYCTWGGASLEIEERNLSLKLIDSELNHAIGEEADSRLHLACFTEALRAFAHQPIVLDMWQMTPFSDANMLGLAHAFPHIQELHLTSQSDFNPLTLKRFYQLKALWLSLPNSLTDFKYLKALQEYPVGLHFDGLTLSHLSLDDLVIKMKEYMIFPNFNPLIYLSAEQRRNMTDRHLRCLIPQKCHSLDLSKMTKISVQAVLEISEKHPGIPMNLYGCMRIVTEMVEGKLSLEDLLKLADTDTIKLLFSTTRLNHYKKQLDNTHIFQLIRKKQVIPHPRLNVSEMPHLQEAGFLQLVQAAKPQRVELLDMPQLYSALKYVAPQVKEVDISLAALNNEDFLEPFLENFLKEGITKKLCIACPPTALDEQLIARLQRKGLETTFFSSEYEFNFNGNFKEANINFKQTRTIEDWVIGALEHLAQKMQSKRVCLRLYFDADNPLNPLEALEGHFNHFTSLAISIDFFKKEIVQNEKNFSPLIQCANLTQLILRCNERWLFNTPVLPILNQLTCRLVFDNRAASYSTPEAFFERLKGLKNLFPNRIPFYCLPLNHYRDRLTDEILLQIKPEERLTIPTVFFTELSKVTPNGAISYLENIQFRELHISGSPNLLADGARQRLQELYPHAKIVHETI